MFLDSYYPTPSSFFFAFICQKNIYRKYFYNVCNGYVNVLKANSSHGTTRNTQKQYFIC